MFYGRGMFLCIIKILITQNVITEAGLACLFCRLWEKGVVHGMTVVVKGVLMLQSFWM